MRRATAVFREFDSDERAVGFDGFRPWFRAAAIYNLLWGAGVILFPSAFFAAIGMPAPSYSFLWRCIGMFVLVYAPGYWWAAGQPFRFRHLILIGCLGKLCGPVGFLWLTAQGELPAVFGWTILTNDLIWLPAFCLFLGRAAARSGGWIELARGA